MGIVDNSTRGLNRKILSRAAVVGLGLAVGAVVLFGALWVLLGNAGVEQFPRLMLSICVPPAVIAALVGGFFLLVRPSK